MRRRISLTAVLAAAAVLTAASDRPVYKRNEKAAFADARTVSFVRPGLKLQVNAAEVTPDGTITVLFTLRDPRGLPLDREGIVTPGAVNLSFIAARIPQGQQQYVAYTTRMATGAVGGTVTQAVADMGGAFSKVSDGQYRYVFGTRVPAGADRTVTHTIGIYGSRNLEEFELGTNYASTTFDFVPSGGAVSTVRDVVRSQGCNKCHDEISAHGGSRRGVELCVLCHTPQTSDPDTGNTVDFPVMIHRIHAGSSLPSVQGGKPYQIIGFRDTVFDWSTVVFPAGVRRCGACHEAGSEAAQKNAHLTRPTRSSCGSCHDDIHFASGVNHAGGPQISDNQCATCHIPQGELEFDASIQGAHVVPQESAMLSGLVLDVVRVEDGSPGKKPIVGFTVKDKAGAGVPLSKLDNVSLLIAGPAAEYGPDYVSESAAGASCTADGACRYTFQKAIAESARGTYSVGIEARRTETLLPGTTRAHEVRYGAQNKVLHFTVDGSPVQPRRAVADTARCNQCHARLSVHGDNRNEVAMCVLCHSPRVTDADVRVAAQDPADRTQPPQGVNFNLLIHRMHSGELLKEAGRPYVVVGFRGSHNDFSKVRYPALSPSGSPGDLRNCALCHVNDSDQNLTLMKRDVADPQGPIDPVKPITSSCTGCHADIPAASHALVNTSRLGESCNTCHGPGSQFSVARMHAQ